MSDTCIGMLEHPEYLEFVISGDPTEQEWISLLHEIVESISRTGKPRVFIDASQIDHPVDSMIRYRMGIRTGETFGVLARIAALRPVWNDDNFWETVATNRGAIAKSGEDRSALIEWLLCDE
ncbi:hypothetical protein C5Y96_12995 [Blastopirellula marina]|uniref:STAS/SEC14 domain-containing protein n=1 Tax=Blastopirellula marina TaxID=124 RepID=A0A2S8FGE4_9BACT|nr:MULTISPECIES: hypothetical protein [Pirellulaceae]PQO31255.1 hypothetical protein C5Y96_12995 [Blastopirellula marina]RCS51649.1 hypothetical protein DTL36_13005 [Bremerella cremea]